MYDGYTTRDPVILKFCGGGEPVPEATSSGTEILVEFTTSPYGTFLHPTPPHSLHGFQLEVQVRGNSVQTFMGPEQRALHLTVANYHPLGSRIAFKWLVGAATVTTIFFGNDEPTR